MGVNRQSGACRDLNWLIANLDPVCYAIVRSRIVTGATERKVQHGQSTDNWGDGRRKCIRS